MSSNARVVIHLLTMEFGSPSDAPPSREVKKLAGGIANILKAFEEKQLEDVYDENHLEVDEDCVDAEWTMGNEEKVEEYNQTGGSGTVTFSGGLQVTEDKVWAAAEYHWSTSRKSCRSRNSARHSFAFLRSERDWFMLKRFYEEGLVKRSERYKMMLIVEALQKKVVQKINLGLSVHDRDLM